MCLIIAVLALFFSLSAFYAGELATGFVAAAVAVLFSVFIYRNIVAAKNVQNEKKIKKEKSIDH